MPSGRDVFLRLLVGELGTPKLAQTFAYGEWLYPCKILLHGASDLDQRCLRTHNSEDGCTFPIKYLRPYPQSYPKTPFWRPFNAKPIIHGALRKSYINGTTKLKLYSHIGIGKYLGEWGVSKFSPLGGIQGAGPLYANLGHPILSRKLLELES